MKYRPIKFPKDEQEHKCIVEWWYWNGRLTGENGREYAFMDCLFKTDVKRVKVPFLNKVPVKILHFHHSILSDLKSKKWQPSIEIPTILSADSFTKPLLFVNHTGAGRREGYVNYAIEETEKFSYILRNADLDLKLTSVKPPLLEGGNGFLDLRTKQTYYYSLTNLKTEGRVRVGDKWVNVKGKSWMDHQWADATYSREKWSWFSVQLDNGNEIVACEYEDRGFVTRLAGIMDKDGRQSDAGEIMLTPSGKPWVSPKTKAVYPTLWRLQIPKKKIDLMLKAVIKEQEMVFGPINYWEGPVNVDGKMNGRAARGVGFMELAGYPSKYTDLDIAREDIEKKVSDFLKNFRNNIFEKK